MDLIKCQALKDRLESKPFGEVIPVAEFFDGNDDVASIGCNLNDHPGVDVFRSVLTGLLKRPDVEAIYCQISELDPGEDCWPFSDTMFVVGNISVDELQAVIGRLQPDEVAVCDDDRVPQSIVGRHQFPILAVWWD